jgi:hypothetical protein
MPRRISSGTLGRQVLGSIVTEDNTLQSVIANSNIILQPNGTGIVNITSDLTLSNNSSLTLSSNNSNNVNITAPTSLAATYSLSLPGNDGDTGQALTTNGSGVLSWEDTGVNVVNELADNNSYYPVLTTATTGSVSDVNTSSSKLSFNPSSGNLTISGSVSCVGVAAGSGAISTTGTLSSGAQTVSGKITTTTAVGANTTNSTSNLEISDSGAGAASQPSLSFHRPGIYATKITLASDNAFWFGGWSAGAGAATIRAGQISPGATNTYDLGTSSLRWRNIYTQDLHLSNGIGDYTVVEGEEDLFLYNNLSGKVFKFALIEVDKSEAPAKMPTNEE